MNSKTVADTETKALTAALNEPDKDIQKAASIAIGRAGLHLAQMTPIAEKQKVIL